MQLCSECGQLGYDGWCQYCLAEDTQVLTDRGFMSRAEVFAACPELAPSSPIAAPASDNDALPSGGAVPSREAIPLYWTPWAAEVKADAAAGIRYEKMGSSDKSSVQLCDSAERYGRQCGVCGERVWSRVSQGGARTQLAIHVRLRHPAEKAATVAARTGGHASVTSASSASSTSRRASLSTASSSPSSLSSSSLSSSSSDTAHSARPPLARPPSLPVGSRSSVDEKEQEALRHATLQERDGGVRRGSLQFKNPSAMSDVSVEQPPAPSTTSSGVAETGTRSSRSAGSNSARSTCAAVLPVSWVGQSVSSSSSVVSLSFVASESPASRQRVTSESPASFTRSLLSASTDSDSEHIFRPNAPHTCEHCGDDEFGWIDDAARWYCYRCCEYASEEWVAMFQDEEEPTVDANADYQCGLPMWTTNVDYQVEEEEKDVPMLDQMDEQQYTVDAACPSPAAPSSPLLFASLDPSTGHLVYLPATALTYKLVTQLVEFTHHAEAPHWAEDADEYGLTPEQVKRMKARSDRARAGECLDEEDEFRAKHPSNGVSLLVDRQHDMFVRVGLAGRKTAATDYKHDDWSADYVKVKAGALLSDDIRQRVRMMGCAEAGLVPIRR